MTSYFLRTLFVHSEGTRLVLDHDAVRALRDGVPPRRLPLNAIDAVIVLSGVDVSTALLLRCATDGRTVAFLSRYGKPRAIVEGATSGRGALRRLQFARHFDEPGRTAVARSVVAGKIAQMEWGLRQWARDASDREGRVMKDIGKAIGAIGSSLGGLTREQLLGVEGTATRRYFTGLSLAIKADLSFQERTRRPPRDPINATMSFLYGLAKVDCHGALHAAGLDAYCGFLHGDRDGQPALVLDLMEEMRPSYDRLAVTLINRRQLEEHHFEPSLGGGCSLTDEGRRILMDALHRYRMQPVKLKSARMEVPRAAIAILQANHLANALRAEAAYVPHELPVR